MPASAGRAYVDILPRFTKFAAGLQAGMNRVGKRLDTIGRNLTRTLALPLAAAGAASVKLAIDFEESMSRIQGLVGLTAKEVDQLGKAVLTLAPKVGKGPRELAEALYFVVSSGIDAADAMKVVEASARAAAAGLGETQTVADAVTSAMNAYATQGLTAAQATDVLTATVREGKGEASELANVIGRVIPVAANVGVEFHEVGAAIASMTLTGLDAAEAVTALRQFFVLLLKPAKQSREALSELGLTAGDVAQITQRLDLSLTKGGLSVDRLREIVAERGLLEGMTALKTALGDNKDALGDVIPNVRALTGFLSITGESAEQNAEIFRELAVATGATDKAFAAASQTARQKMNQALAGLQSAGVRLGAALLPVVKDIADFVTRLAESFSKLPDPVKRSIIVSTALVAALYPIVKIGGLVARTIGGMARIFKLGRKAIIGFTGAKVAERTALEANNRAAAAGTTAVGGLRGAVKKIIPTLGLATKVAGTAAGAYAIGTVASKSLGQAHKDTSKQVQEFVRQIKAGQQPLLKTSEGVRGLSNYLVNLAKRGEAAAVAAVKQAVAQKYGTSIADRAAMAAEKLLGTYKAQTAALPTLTGRTNSLATAVAKLPILKSIRITTPGMAAALSNLNALRQRVGDIGTVGIRIYSDRFEGRQHGGPVWPGRMYVVGERGPELFQTSVAGRIISNDELAGEGQGPGATINFYIDNPDPMAVAREVERKLREAGVSADARIRMRSRVGTKP